MGYKRWLLLGPWLIIATVSTRQLLSVRQPVTAEEWWGIAMVSLALLGMIIFQIAALVGKGLNSFLECGLHLSNDV